MNELTPFHASRKPELFAMKKTEKPIGPFGFDLAEESRDEADIAPNFIRPGRDLLLRRFRFCRDRKSDLEVDRATFQNRPVRDWICSLSPYPCLALFSLPVILLEPIKFVAAYLAATGNFLYAIATFVVGELLKLVMIERLFDLTRKKLLRIPAFAFAYGHYLRARTWILQTEAVQAIRSFARSIADRVRVWQHDLSGLPSRFLASDTAKGFRAGRAAFLALKYLVPINLRAGVGLRRPTAGEFLNLNRFIPWGPENLGGANWCIEATYLTRKLDLDLDLIGRPGVQETSRARGGSTIVRKRPPAHFSQPLP